MCGEIFILRQCQFDNFLNFRPFLVGKWPYPIIAKLDNYKKSTFSPQKIKPLGTVHLDWISDKLDYLRSPG